MAQRGRPKKNISEIKELISSIKPAISASECAKDGGNSTVTVAKPPKTDTTYDKVNAYCEKRAITPDELVDLIVSFEKQILGLKTAKNKPEQLSHEEAEKQKKANNGLNAYDRERRMKKLGF